MKTFLKVARFIVGVLFIFSGLIKANDPLGLSYKMQEFFEVWNMHFLNDYTLALAVIMITFEIIAGVAVLLGWRMNLFSWLLLLLIIFFTFLTGYALFSGKIRECGCFGDCIPLQAQQSFIKDLVLLVLIVVIFPYRRRIRAIFNSKTSGLILLITTVLTLAFQWYVLTYLPVVDCLPYKAGNNIVEKMKAPPGSVPDSTIIVFTYEKNGKAQSFPADNFPADFDDSYAFVKREDKIVRAGTAVAAIRDFTLQTENGTDTTAALLSEPGKKLFLFVKDGFKKGKWMVKAGDINSRSREKGLPVFIVTNLEKIDLLTGVPVLRADGTAIKTAARHNPTLFLIDGGTIIKKWSAADFDVAAEYIDQIK